MGVDPRDEQAMQMPEDPASGRAAGRGSAEGDFQLKTCSSSFIQFEKPCIDCRTACIVVRLAAGQHFISKYYSLGKCGILSKTKVADFTSVALIVYTWP